MARQRLLPVEIAQIAEERDGTGKPPRSLRTLSRWRQKGPPPPIKSLLETAAGRRLLAQWIEQYSQQAA